MHEISAYYGAAQSDEATEVNSGHCQAARLHPTRSQLKNTAKIPQRAEAVERTGATSAHVHLDPDAIRDYDPSWPSAQEDFRAGRVV